MEKAFITFGGTTASLAIGYAIVVATSTQGSHWSFTLLLVLLAITGLGSIVTGIIWFVQWYKNKPKEKITSMGEVGSGQEKQGQTVNEIKTLDWVTCDKCGCIGVRNIKTRELEEMEDNQRRTGQPILIRINSLGDTETRHEKIPECIMQAQDFSTIPPLSSHSLPLFYMQLLRQCPQFIEWQKGSSPKEHKEIIDRQLRQQSTAHNEGSAIPNTLKLPQPPELHISYQKHKFGVFNGEPIITVYAEYRPTGTMRIEAIKLQLVGRSEPSLDWEVYEVK